MFYRVTLKIVIELLGMFLGSVLLFESIYCANWMDYILFVLMSSMYLRLTLLLDS